MLNKLFCFLLVSLVHLGVYAQTDSLYVEVDTTEVVMAVNEITNSKALHPIFEKIKKIVLGPKNYGGHDSRAQIGTNSCYS
mgnify:CR=1 FL=1